MMRLSLRCTTLVSCCLLSSLALAGPLPKRFTLGRNVPADMWMYMHFVHNPERAWLNSKWQDVFDALTESGIDRDISSLVYSLLGEENRAEAEATVEKWTGLIRAVHWGDLIGEELVFAERFGKQFPEYFALVRGKRGSAEGNMAALVAILKELAALNDQARLTNSEFGGVSAWSLTRGHTTPKHFPFSVELWRKGDVIGLATSGGLRDEIVGLMTSKSEKRPITASARFREAIGSVKPPEDGLVFFDFKSFMRSMTRMMDTAAADCKSKGEGEKKSLRMIATIKKAMTLCDVMDYIIVTVETDGRRELTHQVSRLQQGKQKCALAGCCLSRKPFKRFDQYIPADTTSFNLSGLVDLEMLYKLVIDFVRDEVPDGADYLAKWNNVLASIGFDPQRDLFSWLSGEMISITLPPAVVTPMSSADWVWMIRVKNGELASKKVGAAIDFVSGKLQANGQMLMTSPAAVNAEGFRQVTHPILMMFMHPVIGVKDEWLMIASSAETLNKCLAVSAGKASSIVANERFKREGLNPSGPVLSCSFKDTSKFGQELGAAAGMAGMMGGMVTAMIPDRPETRKLKQVIQKALTMVVKLAPVLQKMDFYSSESSMSTYDGAMIVRTEKVVTYKPPTSGEAKTAEAR